MENLKFYAPAPAPEPEHFNHLYDPSSATYCEQNAMNILALARSFYVVQALEAATLNAAKFEPFRHSHARFQNDFTLYKNWFIKKLARAMHDYTTTVVAGELRHCKGQARIAPKNIQPWRARSRSQVFSDAHTQYSATSILDAGVYYFNPQNNRWSAGFGGAKWMQIAKAGLYFGNLPDAVFIDHCVDLSHNNSVYFDKGAGIFTLSSGSEYKEFLDFKYTAPLEDVLGLPTGKELAKLVERAENIGIITRNIQKTREEQNLEDCRRNTERELAAYNKLLAERDEKVAEGCSAEKLANYNEALRNRANRVDDCRYWERKAELRIKQETANRNEAERRLKAYRPLRWSATPLDWTELDVSHNYEEDEDRREDCEDEYEERRREREEDRRRDEDCNSKPAPSYPATEKHEASDLPLNW